MSTLLKGHVLTPRGFVSGELSIGEDGRVAAITGDVVDEIAFDAGDAAVIGDLEFATHEAARREDVPLQ